MADTTEDIVLRFVAEKAQFEADVEKMAARIKVLSVQMKSDAKTIGAGLKEALPERLSPAIDKAVKSLKEVAPAASTAEKAMTKFGNTTLGILTARVILGALHAIKTFFADAVKYAQDARTAMVQINFAEAVLSKKGMDISIKELDGYIALIEEKYKYLSTLQVTKIVGEVASAAVEFDFSKEDIAGLSDAIAFMTLQSQMMGGQAVEASHVMNALGDSRSNFFNALGVNLTKTMVDQEAVNMGMVKYGEELTKSQRLHAGLAVVIRQTSGKQADLNAALEGTPLGNQMELTKNYNNALQTIGTSLLTVKGNVIEFLAQFSPGLADGIIGFFADLVTEVNLAIDSLQGAVDGINTLASAYDYLDSKRETNVLLNANMTLTEKVLGGIWKLLKNIGDALWPFESLLGILQGIGAILATIGAYLVTFWMELAAGFELVTVFQDAGKNAGTAFITGMSDALRTGLEGEDGAFATWFKKQWKDATGIDLDAPKVPNVPTSPKKTDTPTGAEKLGLGNTPEETDLSKALEKMNKEILDTEIKYQQDLEDIRIDFGRKMEDITLEYAQKRADIEKDYASKIADINRDYADKISDIQSSQAEAAQKNRNDQLKKEQEFQNRMQEMKENFMMDLEDALHARDARQILKLIKQYNLEKLQAERKHKLDKANDALDYKEQQAKFARERADAEKERKRKLEDAQRDYLDKLSKLQADEDAERQAAATAANRKMDDLIKNNADRLAIIGANLVAEYNLTQDRLNAIVDLYRQKYGEVSQIYAAMMTMLGGQLGGVTDLRSGGRSGGVATSTSSHPGGGGAAQGGTFIANRPTNMTFGEGGLEMATFTPIGRTGADVSKVFSNMGGGGGGSSGGNIQIEVLLSPDLESRIVKNTLGKTAEIISRVGRTK